MALGKYYEDTVEARRENGAAIVFDYQHPQENPKRVTHVETPSEPRPSRLTFRNRIALRVFVLKLEANRECVSPELLEQTREWTAAHFRELARRSPEAAARLAMAYRDETVRLKPPPEPSFRAVAPRKPVVVEIRKRRMGVLHLPSYAECH